MERLLSRPGTLYAVFLIQRVGAILWTVPINDEARPAQAATAAPGHAPTEGRNTVGDNNAAAGNETSQARPNPDGVRMGEPEPWLAQAIVRESPEAIVVADPEGIIRLWNSGAERMFGHTAAE